MIAVFKREVKSFFNSPIGYVCVAVLCALYGFYYYQAMALGSSGYIPSVFGAMFSFCMMIIPIITMRSMSDDQKNKTDQALLTAPVGVTSIVLGKFLACFFVYFVGTALGGLLPAAVMSTFSSPAWGEIVGNFIGTLLYGAAMIAIGVFISSLTVSQVIAAIGTFLISVLLMYIDMISSAVDNEVVDAVVQWISFNNRYDVFTQGIFSISNVVFFLSVEYNNPATFGSMPLPQKMLNALFQSVTLRTAGFASFNQGGLLDSSIVVSCVLMLIGGSSGSTAGGLKTVTAALLLLSLRANLAGREQVTIRGRAISYRKVIDAMTLALIIVFLFMTGSILISLVDGVPYLHAAFETASALGTVGVTVGITPTLSPVSHVILICLMYLGRIGVLTFSMAFLTRNRYPAKIKYPNLDIMIG